MLSKKKFAECVLSVGSLAVVVDDATTFHAAGAVTCPNDVNDFGDAGSAGFSDGREDHVIIVADATPPGEEVAELIQSRGGGRLGSEGGLSEVAVKHAVPP